MTTSVSTTQLNLRIISIVVFTCICYLSIGLPLAVLPGYIHYQLGYSTFIAGVVISLQYIATLVSRPHAGRYTDIWGPKKVVSLGIICCMLSGLFTLLAVLLQAVPPLAVTALLVGRIFLGVGESFTATGATLWGIKTVGAIHTSRVISWNGVATYVAMAVGAPLGVLLNSYFGISGFAIVVVLVAIVGLLFARTRQDVSVTAGIRAPFHVVVRKIWPYGMGLALSTVGFGVIATFITLYFSAHSWQGAAFTLSLFSVGFICIRLVLGNMITRYGGVPVSLACFVVECLGLLIIWYAPSAWIAGVGAFLTGSGFSLVFPALGVEAVKQVEEQNQGTALGTYSAFLDLALGLTGPVAGWVAGYYDLDTIYLLAAVVVALAFILILRIYLRQRADLQRA
ncbi:MAG: MFS transporter [Klebsiella huaxiensis]|uniref:MFS transporter n=1 Tax=Klebsiella huaxiensis TaxID=2153354 RepID=UPI0026EDD5DD|nr:MFS transporter [Klebsiella huaxiensis]WEJ91074.1 MAG: MFS transporter [Klebsiella huaxiensis]